MVIALVAAGTSWAQWWGTPETVSIQGTAGLQNGQFVIISGDSVYFVPLLGRYVGFIDGLREGASVSIEGFAFGNHIRPVRMTIGGRSYDLGPAGGPAGSGNPGWRPGDFGGFDCCRDYGRRHPHHGFGRRGRW